jgi:hypothetical protein
MNRLALLWLALPVLGPGPTAVDVDDALYEAAFRQQRTELLDVDPFVDARTVLCFSIDPGGAPQSVTREHLARLKLGPRVRRGAECEVRTKQTVELATNAPAIVVTVGPIDWQAPDEAWVVVTQTWSVSKSTRRHYRVVREPDGSWTSLGPIFKGEAG